ncbi:MAG: glycosyltransferase, partial [Desulfohalobiaceae bacterium]
LERLLSSFFALNTHSPVELIVVDLGSRDNTLDVLARYAVQGCVRHLILDRDQDLASGCNQAAKKARYPFLLFLQSGILLLRDVLAQAVKKLQQYPGIGAVSAQLEAKEQLIAGCTQAFAARSAFMLCRKADFESLSGLDPQAGQPIQDLSLRLQQDLGKTSWVISDQPCLARQASDRIQLRYYPDYTRGNPYQRLLYQPFPDYFQIGAGGLEDILADMQNDTSGCSFVWHLHWTNPVLRDAQSLDQARGQLHDFLKQLDVFLDRGGVLVWTVHNILPHETQYPELEQELCQALASRAHVIHVHSPLVPNLVSSTFEVPLSKMVVAPHGNYINVYPVNKDRVQARQDLGLPQDVPVFLFLGKIRTYKGLHKLESAIETCQQSYPSSHLVIAGKAGDAEAKKTLQLLFHDQQIHVFPGFVPHGELGNYLQAADYMVLPYERVLTSGSLILAQSFAVPPIVPDLGLMRDHVQDGVSGYLYDPEEPEALARAMLKALENHGQHSELSAGALQAARSLPWQHSAAMLAARISSEVYRPDS